MNEVSDKTASNILADLRESERLGRLSDKELVMEALQSEVGDIPVVQELMLRVDPDWKEEL